MKRTFVVFSLLLVFGLVLAACGSAPAQTGETKTIVQTVVVTVEVPVGGTPAAPAPTQAPPPPAGYGETLKTVKARGKLICGVNSAVPGFGYVDSAGNFSGFDVDYCRVLAAAILATHSKWNFVRSQRQSVSPPCSRGNRYPQPQHHLDDRARYRNWEETSSTPRSMMGKESWFEQTAVSKR